MSIFLRKLFKKTLVQPDDISIWIEERYITKVTYSYSVKSSNSQDVIDRIKQYGAISPYYYTLSVQEDGLGGFQAYAITTVQGLTGYINQKVPLDSNWINVNSNSTTTYIAGYWYTYTPSSYISKSLDSGWNSSAVSNDSIVNDGEVSFNIDPNSIGVVIGLNQNKGASGYSGYVDIDYAVYASEGLFSAMENGLSVTNLNSFTIDDVFKIKKLGVKVEYFKNDILFYTSDFDSTDTNLLLDVSLYSAGDNVFDASVVNLPDSVTAGVDEFNSSSSMSISLYSITDEQSAGVDEFNSSSSMSISHYEIDDNLYSLEKLAFNSGSSITERRTSALSKVDFNSGSSLILIQGIETYSLEKLAFNSGSSITERRTSALSKVDFNSGSSLTADFYIGVDSINIAKPTAGFASDSNVAIGTGDFSKAESFSYDTSLIEKPVSVSINVGSAAYSTSYGASGGVIVDDTVQYFEPALGFATDTNEGIGRGTFSKAVSFSTVFETIENYGLFEGFKTSLQMSGDIPAVEENNLQGFKTSLNASGGSKLDLNGFKTSMSATGDINSYGTLLLTGFKTSLSGTITNGILGSASFYGFKTSLNASGGSKLDLNGFKTSMSATGDIVISGNLVLKGFKTSLSGTGDIISSGVLTLGLPTLDIIWGELKLTGFRTSLSGGTDLPRNNLLAYSINISSAETTKYTNYDFDRIVRFLGQYYGVKNEGLFLLENQDDNGINIECRIKTSMSDFGTALLKRVPYVYIDSDDNSTIKTHVDGKLQGKYVSNFNGRRTKLPRGSKGRFWEFEVENIKGNEFKIGSLELYIQHLSRKV